MNILRVLIIVISTSDWHFTNIFKIIVFVYKSIIVFFFSFFYTYKHSFWATLSEVCILCSDMNSDFTQQNYNHNELSLMLVCLFIRVNIYISLFISAYTFFSYLLSLFINSSYFSESRFWTNFNELRILSVGVLPSPLARSPSPSSSSSYPLILQPQNPSILPQCPDQTHPPDSRSSADKPVAAQTTHRKGGFCVSVPLPFLSRDSVWPS